MTRKPKYVKRQYNKSGYHGRRGVEHYPQKYIGHAEQKDNIGRKAYCIAKPNTLKLLSKYRSCEYCFFFFFFFLSVTSVFFSQHDEARHSVAQAQKWTCLPFS